MISSLLTIVIPTRDRPDLLRMCLESVFDRQSIVPKVVVSDNSTSSYEATESLKKQYAFSYVRQTGRLSMTEHHNACLELAETPWALLLHDDDELYPQVLSELEPFLSTCEDAGMVVGGYQCIDEDSVTHDSWVPERSYGLIGEKAVLSLGLDFRSFPPNTLYQVEAFREVNGFPDALGAAADYPLVLQLANTFGVAFFPSLLGSYRTGSHQATDYTRTGAERMLEETIRMSGLTRSIGVRPEVADQLIDYNVWWKFQIMVWQLFESHPFFVAKLFERCLRETPSTGLWKSRIKEQYPVLFLRPLRFSIALHQTVFRYLPASVRDKLSSYGRGWLGCQVPASKQR